MKINDFKGSFYFSQSSPIDEKQFKDVEIESNRESLDMEDNIEISSRGQVLARSIPPIEDPIDP